MHELGIVFHVIKSVEKIGEENGLTNVASVTLELGEVSGAIPHELESCWNWAVKRTELLPEAALKIETIPAVTYCEGCGATIPRCSLAAPARTAAAKKRGSSRAARST